MYVKKERLLLMNTTTSVGSSIDSHIDPTAPNFRQLIHTKRFLTYSCGYLAPMIKTLQNFA